MKNDVYFKYVAAVIFAGVITALISPSLHSNPTATPSKVTAVTTPAGTTTTTQHIEATE